VAGGVGGVFDRGGSLVGVQFGADVGGDGVLTEAKFMEIAGSGPIRIATRSDLRRREREQLAKRDVAPLEGTQMSLWNSIIPNWWDQNINQSFLFGDPTLAERVWVANRCQQMNAQQIASMPLGLPRQLRAGVGVVAGSELVSERDRRRVARDRRPDVRVGVLVPVRDRHVRGRVPADVDGAAVVARSYRDGRRRPARTSSARNHSTRAASCRSTGTPGRTLHGCSALRAYAQMAWGLLAAGNQSMR
jgi:hypothetical protein